ncbi:MAG: hypothetical protein WBM54_12415 [Woeseia sp.]
MKFMSLLSALMLATLLGACSTTADRTHAIVDAKNDARALQPVATANETLLLVSLEDGSVIMQTINSDADICFKQITDSSTTCLIQGAPILDPVTQAVIGFETTEAHIDLVASSSY